MERVCGFARWARQDVRGVVPVEDDSSFCEAREFGCQVPGVLRRIEDTEFQANGVGFFVNLAQIYDEHSFFFGQLCFFQLSKSAPK
jgi:hypothetical protein